MTVSAQWRELRAGAGGVETRWGHQPQRPPSADSGFDTVIHRVPPARAVSSYSIGTRLIVGRTDSSTPLGRRQVFPAARRPP